MAQVKTDEELEAEFSALAPKVPGQPDLDEVGLEAEFAKLSPGAMAQQVNPASVTESTPSRLGRMAVHSFVGAGQNLLGLPGSLEQWGNKNLPSWTTNQLSIDSTGVHFAPPGERNPLLNLGPTLPSSEQIQAQTGMGLEQNPDLEARNAVEKYLVQAPAKMLPDAALMYATGGGGLLPALMTSAGATYAAEAAQDLAPESPILPIIAGVAGALGGYGTAGSILKRMDKAEAAKELELAMKELTRAKQAISDAKYTTKPVTAEQEALEAAQDAKWEEAWKARMGREPTQAERELEASKRFKFEAGYDAQKAATELKQAAGKQLEASQKLTEQTLGAVDEEISGVYSRVADTLGKPSTLQEAGTELQTAARNWKEKVLPKKVAEVEAPLNRAIPEDTLAQLDNFTAVAEKLSQEAGSLQSLADMFSGTLPKQVTGLLEKRKELGSLVDDAVVDAAEAAPVPPPTWSEVKALRTRLGDAMSNPSLIKGVSEQQLSAMYSALTADLSTAAKRVGAEDLFQNYNEQMTALSAFQQNVLEKVLASSNAAKESISPEAAAKAMLSEGSAGGTWLAALRAELPDAANALAAATVRQGEKTWAGLSPEAQLALVPDAQKVGALRATAEQRTAAQAQAKEALARAKADHDEQIAAAEAGLKEGNFNRLKQVMDLQAERKAAEAAQQKDQLKTQMEREKAVREAQKAQREAAREAEKKAKAQAKGRAQAKSIAEERVSRAQARQAPEESTRDQIRSAVSRVSGGYLTAEHLLPMVLKHAGVTMGPGAGITGFIGGSLLAPAILNAAKTVFKNPRAALGLTATGLTAGENALTGKGRPAGR